MKAEGPLRQLRGIIDKIASGQTNVVALAIGSIALLLILLLKRWRRVPGILIVVVAATMVSAVLGRVDHVKGYRDITRYTCARVAPGLVLFRWEAPLFFANAEFFHERALEAVASSPTPVRWLVIAAEPVTSVDVTAADVVCELDDKLREAGIDLCFAEMKDPVKD